MRSKKGFTLVELIAVISILSILMIILIPNITKFANQSKVSLRESKINTFISAGEQYGVDYINQYQSCLSSLSSSELSRSCTISIDDLIKKGYLNAENDSGYIVDPITDKKMNGNVLLCFDQNNVSIYGKFVEPGGSYSCDAQDAKLGHTLNLSSSNGVGYIGGDHLELNILATGAFSGNFTCESSNSSIANCSISGRKITINITNNRSYTNDSVREIDMTIKGKYYDENRRLETISKVFKLKVYSTELKILGEDNACIRLGSVSTDYLEAKNTGPLTIEISNPNVLDGIAKNKELFYSAHNQTGQTSIKVTETNGKLTATTNKFVYQMDVSEISTNVLLRKVQEITINHAGTGTITVSSSNPDVIKFQKNSETQSGTITINSETTFKIIATGMGTSDITIKGETCGEETRTIKVSNLSLESTEGVFYVNGASKDIAIRADNIANLTCESSNPSVASCAIHSSIMTITPHAAGGATIKILNRNNVGGYEEYKVTVHHTSIQVIDGSNNEISNVCHEKGTTQTFTVIGPQLGTVSAEALEGGWYLADVSISGNKTLTVRNRSIPANEAEPPYQAGYNTGNATILVSESNTRNTVSLNYKFYELRLSSTSATIRVERSTSFRVTASNAGNISASANNSNVSLSTSLDENGGTVTITGMRTGSSTITVRGGSCGTKTFTVTVQPKVITIYFTAGWGISSVSPSSRSCNINTYGGSCSVSTPSVSHERYYSGKTPSGSITRSSSTTVSISATSYNPPPPPPPPPESTEEDGT